jgi:hypothetical protein
MAEGEEHRIRHSLAQVAGIPGKMGLRVGYPHNRTQRQQQVLGGQQWQPWRSAFCLSIYIILVKKTKYENEKRVVKKKSEF